jgi:hypothetical protein
MKSQASKFKKWASYLATGLLLAGVGSLAACDSSEKSAATQQSTTQLTFATPLEAGQALRKAAQANDQAALSRVLGPKSSALLNSGDPAVDKDAIASFAAKFDRMNRWVTMTDGTRILYIGADNYPFPMPLSQDSSAKWYFNANAGADEIKARKIGKGELLAIDATNSIANAEELYAKRAHDGNAPQYTQIIVSTPGKQDGLYWEVPEDQEPSSLGRVNNFAKSPLTSAGPGAAQEFDGYSFRILNAQGPEAKGGAKNYVVNGKMTGGFAVIATPTQYGETGIMSFILSREGMVYQKDLGAKSAEIAASIQAYNPEDGWTPAE